MFNPFGRKNTDEQDGGLPPIIFANVRRSNRELLTEAGYKQFTATTFLGWALIIVLVWKMQIEIRPTRELVTSLGEAGVGLSALAIAVLTFLHEVNKKDRWFKLALLLVGILFAVDVFGAFFLALTWQPAFDLPQKVTIVFVAVLGAVTLIEIDWGWLLRFKRTPTNARARLRASVTLRRVRLLIPFILPFALIWAPGSNRVTGVLVLFAGGLWMLVALMAVTAVGILTSPEETEREDPFLAALRERFESDVKSLIRVGEIRSVVVMALNQLQIEAIDNATYPPDDKLSEGPAMIDRNTIIERLRREGIADERSELERIIYSLGPDRVIARDGGSYWLMPDERIVRESEERVRKLALIASVRGYASSFAFEGLKLENFRRWLAVELQIPQFVVGEYLVPRVFKLLRDPEEFHSYTTGDIVLFVNMKSPTVRSRWETVVEKAHQEAERECESNRIQENINRVTWRHVVEEFPNYIDDTPDHVDDTVRYPDLWALTFHAVVR